MPLRILVIGGGSVGERHIKNLKSLGKAVISACDSDEKRLSYIKETYGVEVFTKYEEAFSSGTFEGVLVCTPTNNHILPALAAIQEGCHVFMEKPISHTREKVDDLIKAAEVKDLTLMVGFNLRFHPNLQKIKELLNREEIGKPLAARAHFGSYFLYRLPFHPHYQGNYQLDPAAKRIGGGVILDAASHSIDYLRWFLGEVEEVFCYAQKMGKLDLAAEDLAEILLKFEKGTIASLHADFVQQPYQYKCEIIGEQGTITWDFNTRAVSLFTQKDDKWQTFLEEGFEHNQTYIMEMKHFINCIQRKERPLVDGREGAKVLAVALAALASAEYRSVAKVGG